MTLIFIGIDVSDDGDVLIGDSHGNRFHVAVFDKQNGLSSEHECCSIKVCLSCCMSQGHR